MFFLTFQKKILSVKSTNEKRRTLIQKKPEVLRSPLFWDDFLLADEHVKKDVIEIAAEISQMFSKYRWVFEDDELLKKYLMYNTSYLLFWEAKMDHTPQSNIDKWAKNFEDDIEEIRKIIFAKRTITEEEFTKIIEEIPIDLY